MLCSQPVSLSLPLSLSQKSIQGTFTKMYNHIYLLIFGEKVVSEENVINIAK